MEGEVSPTVLVTSHGGFIKDFNMMLVDELSCSMPCENGEWRMICPNTGVSRYNVVLDKEGEIQKVVCTELYYKGHLEGAVFNQPEAYEI